MSSPPRDPNEPFHLELNESGYGFQAAVVKEIQDHRGAQWVVEATEFPVAYRGLSIHIDVMAWLHHHYLFVGECKRVNPAFGSWFFLRSPFTYRRRTPDTLLFEKLSAGHPGTALAHSITIGIEVDVARGDRPWQVGLEVKTDMKGDRAGKGRSLRDAITQVETGVNGLIASLDDQKLILANHQKGITIVPVVFTSARLWVSDSDLSASSLLTGEALPTDVREVPWLWFEDNVSPNLLHTVARSGSDSVIDFTTLLMQRHTRSIAIVGHAGISQFLKYASSLLYSARGF